MWDLIVSVPDHCLSFYFEARYGYSCALHLAGRLYSIAGSIFHQISEQFMFQDLD